MTDSINNEFLKYRRIIASLLRKIRPAASTQDIEDILQDTYINTYLSSLKQQIKFPKAFMVKTAIRLANRQINIARRIDADEHIDHYSDETGTTYDVNNVASQTEKEVLKREDFAFLCEAVEQLPPQCRKVFVLKKIYGLSQREIANKLNLSESTIEKHVAKGLRRTTEYYHEVKSKAAREQGVELSENQNRTKSGISSKLTIKPKRNT